MLAQVILPAAVFTAIVVVLSAIVLLARRGLGVSGVAVVTLNGERRIEVEAGRHLLGALADAGVYLPAACGGKGTCGQCRVRIESGADMPTRTDMAQISEADAARGFRLACMTRVRHAMALDLPPAVLGAARLTCRVKSARFIAPYLKEIVLTPEEGKAFEFRAGDYVLIEAPRGRRDLSTIEVDPAFRDRWIRDGIQRLPVGDFDAQSRAYSLANAPGRGNELTLVIRLALPPAHAPAGTPPGCVSSWLFGLDAGAEVDVSGPFGHFRASDTDAEMVLIGGGAGIAPLRSILLEQLQKERPRRMSFWYGARNQCEIGYALELEKLAHETPGFDFYIALSGPGIEPGWEGLTGFIHEVVRDTYLRDHAAIGTLEFYICGPPLMNAAVLQMLADAGVERTNIFLDDFGS